jgi:hypothetical protein
VPDPAEKRWPLTLADHHAKDRGLWCANCLDYIVKPVDGQPQRQGQKALLQNHHQLPEDYLDELGEQGVRFPRGWTVPVHGWPCHQHHPKGLDLQSVSDTSAAFLSQLDRGRFDLKQHDHLAKQFHDRGLYGHSAIVKERMKTHLKSQGRMGEYWQVLERQVASAAGFRNELSFAAPSAEEPESPELLLARSNDAANRHRWEESRKYYQHANAHRPKHNSERAERLEPYYALRKAQQMERKRDDMDRALAACRGLGYSLDTAKVIGSGILLDLGGARDVEKARDYANELLSADHETSWLYRAESHFLLACVGAGNERPAWVYAHLVVSQYIYVMLGLQGTPHPNVPACRPSNRNAWPGDVLTTNRRLHSLSPASCLGLRRHMIQESDVQRTLLNDLAGWRRDYHIE